MSVRCARTGPVCPTRRWGECPVRGADPTATTALTGSASPPRIARATMGSVPTGARAAPARSIARIPQSPPGYACVGPTDCCPGIRSVATCACRTVLAARTSGRVSTARAWPKISAVRTSGKCSNGSCVSTGACCPGEQLCPGASSCISIDECCPGQIRCNGSCIDTSVYQCCGDKVCWSDSMCCDGYCCHSGMHCCGTTCCFD